MNITLIGQKIPQWYGSMFSQVQNALNQLPYNVITSDRNSIMIPATTDIALFIDCSEDYSNNIPNGDFLKVFWAMDTHMPGGALRSLNIANKCDEVFSSNYEHGVKIFEKFNVQSTLLPITFDHTMIKDSIESIDVAMIGHPNSQERIRLFESLNNKYKAVTGRMETKEDFQSAMSKCKIVVNQPTEPWDMILNNRFFEGLAFKKLLLQKKLQTELIEKLGFIDGVDFVYWHDFKDLFEKIDYYLSHEQERESIVASGSKKVRQYSIKCQLEAMFKMLLSKYYERF